MTQLQGFRLPPRILTTVTMTTIAITKRISLVIVICKLQPGMLQVKIGLRLERMRKQQDFLLTEELARQVQRGG